MLIINENRCSEKSPITWPTKGNINNIVKQIAINLGTNVRVGSWICVKACNREIINPITNATNKNGKETFNSTSIASLATSIIKLGSI